MDKICASGPSKFKATASNVLLYKVIFIFFKKYFGLSAGTLSTFPQKCDDILSIANSFESMNCVVPICGKT